jgi:DNA polymerase III subunit delta'
VFSKLIGNAPVRHALRRLIEKDRVPNSLLMSGLEGVGKRQFALELIRTIICSERAEDGSCGVCSTCKRISSFEMPAADDKDAYKRIVFSDHPDVGSVIPYNRSILVDSIRHLEAEANFRPYEASARFFIIDDAEKMNDAASNALLKTLEEPPPTTHIILITSQPDALLPTIRSRCQTIRFGSVPEEEIERFLLEERAFGRDEALVSARMSRGSVGRAVSMDLKRFADLRSRMVEAVRHAIAAGDRVALLRISEEMTDARNKDTFEESLDVLESLLRDIWKLSVTADEHGIENVDLAKDLASCASERTRKVVPEWIEAIEKMRLDLVVNINRRIATDALFSRMAA